jgi:hypothetical protein
VALSLEVNLPRIFVGELTRIDPEVLDLLKTLPHDFTVLAEFNIGRNVDFLLLRPQPDRPCLMILVETKRVSAAIVGSTDGQWSIASDGQLVPLRPSNEADISPYWQAVNAANAMKQWLWNNQPVYRTDQIVSGPEEFRVWPDLLLLSPPGIHHQLPLRPATSYGRWWTDLESWFRHVLTWHPKYGPQFSQADVDGIARALNLQLLLDNTSAAVESAPVVVEDAEPEDDDDDGSDLRAQVSSLEQRVARLEALVGGLVERRDRPTPQAPPVVSVPARPWTDEEREAVRKAVDTIRMVGKSRALPTVLEYMGRALGYSLADRQYNGFGSARAMFEAAEAQGIVRFGPRRGPNPTIYLPDESVPAA